MPTVEQSKLIGRRERLVVTDAARRFFDEVVNLAAEQKRLSSDQFTVDGTLLDA